MYLNNDIEKDFYALADKTMCFPGHMGKDAIVQSKAPQRWIARVVHMTDNDAWRALSHHDVSTVTRQKNCKVSGPHVSYTENEVQATLQLQRTLVHTLPDGSVEARPEQLVYEFCTKLKPSKLGLMLVGWGGNNGSTVTAGIVANREDISWESCRGMERPNLFGSLSQHGTLRLGITADGTDVFVPFKSLLPLVEPKDIVLSGWDISGYNLAEAMDRAQILEPDLKKKLRPYLADMKPLPGIFDEQFIAKNQLPRADNVIKTSDKAQQVEIIRQDIRKFKQQHQLDFVVVVWTANSERYSMELAGVNDTAENLLKAISSSHKEVRRLKGLKR